MTVRIDKTKRVVIVGEGAKERAIPFASPEAFEIVSDLWLNVGWDVKYVYSFTWLGRPIIQLPEDMFRLQELIYRLKPDVIVETGIAHGGGMVFYAGLCKLMGKGRVVGVDIEIRPHNRAAIESHELFPLMTLIEASSVEPATVAKVKTCIRPGERVLVFLDSNHTKDHVLAELNAYAPLISVGSYIVAMDGIQAKVLGAPRSKPDWDVNNPITAVKEFVAGHPDFVVEEPAWSFNEGVVKERVTYWPSAFVKRVR